jgi:hypothetical protein
MILLAKAALGLTGTLFVAGAYTFHEGVIRIDVDEHREGGSHVHMWVPAAAVPMAMHLVPREHLRNAVEHSREFLLCPLSTLDDVTSQLELNEPGA